MYFPNLITMEKTEEEVHDALHWFFELKKKEKVFKEKDFIDVNLRNSKTHLGFKN